MPTGSGVVSGVDDSLFVRGPQESGGTTVPRAPRVKGRVRVDVS